MNSFIHLSPSREFYSISIPFYRGKFFITIANTPLSLSVSWILVLSWMEFSSGFILFGLYYGFLATLSIGPSQLIAMRAFLLEGNLGGTVAVSGLLTGQLIILLSIHYSPLYVVLLKPHILTLSILPYTFFYWYRIKDLLDYQSLRSVTSLRDIRVPGLFFDSMIFQLLNPILLPSPVFARLLNLFLFRYSNNLLFLTGAISGWLYGQYSFIYSGKLLLFRVESDSPVLYLLLKRIIHRTFGIIILSFSLLHLGRTPVPFIAKKLVENLQFNSLKREELHLPSESWITTSFFDHRRWKRPFRYIANSGFSTKSPVKKKVSQYFFNVCLSDGRPRLSPAYLPSLAIFERNFKKYLNLSEFLPSSEFFPKWISSKKKRRECIYNEFQHRIHFLRNGLTPGRIGENKFKSSNPGGEIFTKFYDPLLMRQSHETMVMSKSPRFFAKKSRKEPQRRLIKRNNGIGRNNRLKSWISNQWQELEYKDSVLPWEPLTQDARRTLSSLINKSKGLKLDMNPKSVNSPNEDVVKSINDGISSLSMHKRMNRKSNINWELILNLSRRQRSMYFTHLRMDKWNIFKNHWKNSLLGDTTSFKSIYSFLIEILKYENQFRFNEMNKEIPRWASDLRNDKFDVIAIGVTDIRQRRVKNLGYLTKGEDRRRKIVRRFSQQSDFRRELVKGSMRARRRKTPIWKIFQLEIKSPFFIRMSGKPTSIRTPLSNRNINGSIKSMSQNILMKKPSLEKTRTDRLAIANRWDFPLAQWGRSWLLIIQSHLRKYLALPTLIVLKNISRFLSLQNPEWGEDWSEWNREIHIRCTYDGTEVSEKELPEQWLRDGLQIKVIYPFHLRPWHNSRFENENFVKSENDKGSVDFVRGRRFHYCYLTAWGFLTDLPFGDMKKQPSFWKPLKKEFRRRRRNHILFNLSNLVPMKKESFKISRVFDSRVVNTQINSIESHSNELNLDSIHYREYETISMENDMNRIRESSSRNNENIGTRICRKYLYERLDYIHYLEDLVVRGTTNEMGMYYQRHGEIEPAKELIRIKQIIIRFYRKGLESVKEWFFLLNINLRKIKTNSKLWIGIMKESIREIFDRSYSNSSNDHSNRKN